MRKSNRRYRMSDFAEEMATDDCEEPRESWLSEKPAQEVLITPEMVETLALLELMTAGRLMRMKHTDRKDN